MRVAAVQDSPVYLNRTATLDLVKERITEAGEGNADLIAFPEVFVSGYPVWIDVTDASAWEKHDQQEAFARYLEQSVELGSSEFLEVVETVKTCGAFTYLGVVERAA